ncbi:hypothetical protein [Formosa algae]|uniref:hypothetical protein n=1 Tax=Formosa algae TaxID=225843 RepID=UPI000CCF54B6|nr:hypothetical protein [Formosa algae]PNW27411.1 hypothetical protein BKP44_13360 [Formosa algae]
MKNKQNKQEPINFKYGVYINYKAFKDYHLLNGISDNYFKIQHCCLMAYIIDEFQKNSNLKTLNFDNEKYVYLGNKFILDNLVYLKIEKSMLQKYLNTLKTNGLIKTHVLNDTKRYINVNNQLLELYFGGMDFSITAINYLIQYKPTYWKTFKNEWEPHFKNQEHFKQFIDNFNNTRLLEGLNNNGKEIFEHLTNAVNYELYKRPRKK